MQSNTRRRAVISASRHPPPPPKMPPPPPPAASAAPRLLLGPALRTQSDRRLVKLVREGYETAFDEIVRRYDRALGRYAAAIVPRHQAEDVTQDAFSKALLALRGTENEIELRPWLYRIVRNTALNELRDHPARDVELLDTQEAQLTVPEQIERREELRDLMERLRALPESQRAAIVMRELEGLSHDEIAAALEISGGAARQAIHRARAGLRDGLGMLVPLPMLRWLLDAAPGVPADAAGAGVGGAVSAGAGGIGTGVALKAAPATVLVAGSVGTGLAIHERAKNDTASAATTSRELGGSPGTPLGAAGSEGPESGAGEGNSQAGEQTGQEAGVASNSGNSSGRGSSGENGDPSS